MNNPTTTAPSVNFNSFAWFANIMYYIELKACALWAEGKTFPNEKSSEAEWALVWPGLCDQMMHKATQQCIAELNQRNLVNSN